MDGGSSEVSVDEFTDARWMPSGRKGRRSVGLEKRFTIVESVGT